jgi:ABC-type branched-subunit amino acid transport system ATPase component/ABC-type branched-subunit amino acid transport system permease subunit
MRRHPYVMALLLTAILVWPLLPVVPYDMVSTAILAFRYLVVALSVVLLIGLVGQISLAQASIVGVGAFVTALSVRRVGLPFPATLLVGAAAGALTAGVIGVVALRVRGLYLAVATMIFAFVCDQYLFRQPWLVENQSGTSIAAQAVGQPGTIPYFDLADAHVFYYVALTVAMSSLYAVANLRDSKLGRAFAAIRGSEIAAASLAIDVTRYKLLGFACAGTLAGLAGAMTISGQRSVAPDQFAFVESLFLLSIAAVGGLRSLGGAVASAAFFAILVGEVFFRSPKLADFLDLISSGLLILVLLFFRGGLGALPGRLRLLRANLAPQIGVLRELLERLTPSPDAPPLRAWLQLRRRAADGLRRLTRQVPGWRRPSMSGEASLTEAVDMVGVLRRLGTARPAPAEVTTLPMHKAIASTDQDALVAMLEAAQEEPTVAGAAAFNGRREPVLLKADGITVQFGGLTAVSDASLQVGAGEIVGLIGPNGAGKTTLFNSILGLNQPAAGDVHLLGHEVGSWPVHRRAALGIGRTFQIIQLFGDLTVFDNLMVATHGQNPTTAIESIVVSGGARRAERAARTRVRAVIELMDLEHVAHRRVTELPFGVLRLVEVARTLVAGAKLVCFDEPASGLDSAETERLISWFKLLRNIGLTLLVIEHDVDMVVRLCDYIYVLDQGRLLAQGTPDQIQRDPAVIASYLGDVEELVS